jgi:hypothetical protein
MPGNQASYGTQKREYGLSAVSLRPSGPLALILVSEKKTKSDAKFGPKMAAARDPGIAGRQT